MKVILFILSMILFLDVQAQYKRRMLFTMTFPDSSYRDFFTEHSDLDRLLMKFENNQAVFVKLFTQQDVKKDNLAGEPYDLTFEGDRYLFEKRYKQFVFPTLPKSTIGFWTDTSSLKLYREFEIVLHKDSISYQMSRTDYGDNEDYFFVPSRTGFAKYTGDTVMLKKSIADVLNEHKAVIDSVLVFQGIVGLDGDLNEVSLISGARSPFSDLVLASIQKEMNMWFPAMQGGRRVKDLVKIFIRINQDSSITIATSG